MIVKGTFAVKVALDFDFPVFGEKQQEEITRELPTAMKEFIKDLVEKEGFSKVQVEEISKELYFEEDAKEKAE